jgi:predicted phage-related endonuclease
VRLKLGLTKEQLAERRNGLGGSDASIIMGGDPAALIALWEDKRGLREGEDLSRVLPVQMGSFTEPLNLYWYELTTGRAVTNEGEPRKAERYPFMRCTLDGLTVNSAGHPAVFQAKHVNAYSKIDEVAQKYMSQLHHEMHVTGLRHAVLSVFIGTMVYEAVEIECDDFYLAQLIDREREFWACVESGEPPAALPEVVPPVLPTKFRTVDMSASNAWASNAVDWKANRAAAKTFETATKELKGLVEADVGRAFGAGIEITRAKNGALTIKEAKAAKEAA